MLEDIFLIIILILISGIFSALEAASKALNANRIKTLADSGEEKAIALSRYLGNLSKNILSLQIGITFFALLAGIFVERSFVVPVRQLIANQLSFGFRDAVSVIFITLLLTYLIVVFGKLLPRFLGEAYAEAFIYKFLGIITLFSALCRPFVLFASITASGLSRLFGVTPSRLEENVTEEEIRMLVDAGGDSGSINENEKEMINNIFEFDNTSVGEIATHRTDIVALSFDAPFEKVLQIVNEEKYSRIPVYNENIDDITGIFHIKDISKYILNNPDWQKNNTFHLDRILMKPYFVPESKKTSELFQEMQKNKIHMAIVIDEYGGTAGIVTMEDLLEEIVGNIFDEYDAEETENIEIIDENTFLIKGTAPIDEVQELLDIHFDDEDYDTIGGYLIGQIGHIPEELEQPEIFLEKYLFKVEKIEEKRIECIRATKSSKTAKEGDNISL